MAISFNMTDSTKNRIIREKNIAMQIVDDINDDKDSNQQYAVNKNKIESLNAQSVHEISLTGNSVFAYNKNNSGFSEDDYAGLTQKKTSFYKEFNEKALKYLTGKKSSAEWIMNAGADMATTLHYSMNKTKSFSSFEETMQGYQSFKDFQAGKKSMYVIDLEALSGRNSNGFQDIDQLTEYAIRKYDNTGKVLDEFTGVIGIDTKTADKYKEIARNFSLTGYREEKNKVALEYFAKLGHQNTKVKEVSPGKWVVEQYAANEAKDIMTKDNILAGIGLSEKIGISQQNNQGWLDEFSGVLKNIQQETDNGTAILAGQNIRNYDIRQINKLSAKFGWESLNIKPENTFDLLPLLQHANIEDNFVGIMYGGTKHLLNGSTPFKQSTIIKNFLGEDYYEKSGLGAHSAIADIQGFYDLITKGKLGSGSFVDFAADTAKKAYKTEYSHGDFNYMDEKKPLLYAKNSGRRNGRIIDFTIDNFSGNIHTSDGIVITPKGEVKTSFAESAIKKGVTYTIDYVTGARMNEEYVKTMKELYPDMAVENMAMMIMHPVIDKETTANADLMQKGNLDIFRFGALDDLQESINNGMINYGTIDKNGVVDTNNDLLKTMVKYNIENTTDGLVLDSEGTTADRIIKDGTKILANDSAARSLRDENYNRYSKYLDLIDEISKEITASNPEEITSQRKKILEEMLNQSAAIAQGAPLDVKSQAERLKPLQDLIGYKDIMSGEQTVMRHTVDNVYASLDYVGSIQRDVRALRDKIEEISKGNNNGAYKDFIFKQGMDALYSNMIEEYGTASNLEGGYIRGYENYFDVDISSIVKEKNYTKINKSMDKINPDNILTIDLNPGGEYDLINKLNRLSGTGTISYNKEVESKVRIEMLANELIEKGILPKDAIKSITEENKDSSFLMAKSLVRSLKEIKKEDPSRGILKSNRVQTVLEPLGISDGEGVFSDSKLKEIFSFLDNQQYDINNFNEIKKGKKFEAARKKVADMLVDKYFIEDIPDDKVLQETYGYNEKQIEKIKSLVSVHRKDATKFAEQLVDAVAENNGQIYVDKYLNKAGMIFGDKFYDISMLPRTRFKDGMVYTQIGTSSAAAYTRLSYNSRNGFELSSGLGEAMGKWFNLKRTVENSKAHNDDPAEALFYKLKSVANIVRSGAESIYGASSVAKFDEQDVKSQFEVGTAKIVDALPDLKEKGFLDNIDLFEKEDFLKLIDDPNFKHKGMSYEANVLIQRNMPTILDKIKNVSPDQDIKTILEAVNYHAKGSAAEKGRFRIDDIHYGWDQFINGSRGITEQARFMPFNKSKTEKYLSANGLEKEIFLGNPVMTSIGRGIAERNNSLTEVILSRNNMDAMTLREKIAKFKNKENISKAEKNAAIILSNLANVTEGGAIADARIADNIFKDYDIQKIASRKELFDEYEKNKEIIEKIQKLGEVMPEFKIDKSGNIYFSYTSGKFVKRNDKLMELIGYGGPEAKFAKDDGVFNFGFFEKGKNSLVDENEVSKKVSEYAKAHGQEIKTVDDFITVAQNLYDTDYYVDSLHAKSLKKLVEDRAEKHMTSFAYMGLGVSEERLKKKNRKIEQVLKGIGLSKLEGQTLNYNIFKQFNTTDISKTILAKMSDIDVTQDDYEKAVHKHFNSVEEFYEAIKHERYLPSDILKDMEVAGASIVSQVDAAKHKTVIAPIQAGITEMYVNRRKAGMTEQEANKDIVDKIGENFVGDDNKPGLTLDKNGKMALGKMSYEGGGYINYDGAEEVLRNDLGKEKFDKIMAPGEITYHTYGVNNDWSGMSINKAKIGTREFSMLGFDKYSKQELDYLKEIMPGYLFNETFGHIIHEDGSFEKRSVLSSYQEQLIKQKQKEKDYKSKIKIIASGKMAVNYNANGTGIEDLKKAGFTENKVNLTDIKIPTGGDAEFISRDNMIVNLKDDIITDDILKRTNLKNKDHIAIVGNIKQQNGNEIIQPEYQKSLNRLVRTRNELELEMNRGNDADKDRISHLKDKFVETVNTINQEQSGYISGKNDNGLYKDVNTNIMEKSVMGKSVVVDQRAEAEMLKKAKISGKSLKTWADEGVFFDASFRSKEAFKQMGFFDKKYMEGVFGNKDEYANLYNKKGNFNIEAAEKLMEHKLSTEGVLGFVHRFPTIYRHSFNSAQLFLSKDLADNQAADTYMGALFKHEDADGDITEAIVAQFYNKDGELIDSLKDKTNTGLKDVNADLHMHAFDQNTNAAEKIKLDEEELAEQFDNPDYNRDLATRKGNTGNKVVPRMERALTKSEYDKVGEVAREFGITEQAAGIASVKRANAGSINLPNFKLRKMANMARDANILSDEEFNAIDVLAEASEEGFLSPKHSEKEIVENKNVMNEYNKLMSSLMYNSRRQGEDAKAGLKTWMETNAKGRIRETLYKMHGMENMSNEKIKDEFIDTGVEAIAKIFENVRNISGYSTYMSIGGAQAGTQVNKINEMTNVPAEDNSLQATNMRAVNNAYEKDNSAKKTDDKMFSSIKQTSNQMNSENAEKIGEEAKETAQKIYYGRQKMANYTEGIAKRVEEIMKEKSLSARKLAIGSVGLAGAIMVAGFVGGNPSIPNQQEANNADGAYNTQKMPSLTDTNVMKSTNSGPTKGYVININAQSDNGRKNAQEAIQTAMGATMSRSNVNISMNINDQTGNITNSRRQNDSVLDYIETLF